MTEACPSICDFCEYYAFNADEHGAYVDKGECEHPEHRRPSEPDETCPDFACILCPLP